MSRILSFGNAARCDARLISLADGDGVTKVEAEILGRKLHFRIGAPGAHNAANALGALLAVAVLEGDVLNAAAALSGFSALKGRGQRSEIAVAGGKVGLIDESYNANPASMEAALANLGSASPAPGARRVAVLGDMLELGPQGVLLHAGLAEAIEAARADLVFLCGTQMAALWDRLPASRRGAYGENSSDIAGAVANAIRTGDVVLVKGSLGSKMAAIVEALKAPTA